MTRLILIRHGQTSYSRSNRYCGFSDPSLSKKGREESQRLAKRLTKLKVDSVFSSDLKRALQTARIVFRDKKIEKIREFRELHFGRFEGLKHEDIMMRYPKIYRRWIEKIYTVRPPGGESLKQLERRVKKKLGAILSGEKGKIVAIVTHAGPIKVILCDALRLTFEKFWGLEQDFASLSVLDLAGQGKGRVVKMNSESFP